MRKFTWLVLIVAFLGLSLMGCPKSEEPKKDEPAATATDDDEADDEAEDEAADEEKDEEEKADEEKAEEKDDEASDDKEDGDKEGDDEDKMGDEEKKEDEVELPSRENYIEAAVSIGCTDLDTSIDASQKTERRKEILAKYGFTTDTYDAAQKKFAADPTVKPVIENRVSNESCKKDVAEDDKEDPTKVGDPDKDKKPTIGYGNFKGSVKGGGVRGQITLTIKPSKLSGNAKGTRNGEKWNTGFSGSVRGATFSGSGGNKNTRLNIQGRIAGKSATGTITGKLNGKTARMTFSASR